MGYPNGYDHKYTYSNIGYNLKASDMQAAIEPQIEKLPDFIEIRDKKFPSILTKNLVNLKLFDPSKMGVKSSTKLVWVPNNH